jgi:hypothetical protein
MESIERKARAELRRQSAVIIRTELADPQPDSELLRGLEAMSLAWKLTSEAWSLSGQPWPEYERTSTPLRFEPKSD